MKISNEIIKLYPETEYLKINKVPVFYNSTSTPAHHFDIGNKGRGIHVINWNRKTKD